MQSYINKTIILLTCLALILILCGSASAATVTWTGGGGDNNASTDGNWSSGIIPQTGDRVIFDSTSSDDCSWNVPVTLNAFTLVSGYTGTVTKLSGVSLTIAKSIIWTGGGTDNLASNPENWSDNAVPQDDDKVVFNEASSENCEWNINISPSLFSINSTYSGTVSLSTEISVTGDLTLAGGTFDLNDRNLTVYGYLLIGADGTLNATSSTITVKGDWGNYGNFIYGTSTVVLAGTNRVIYGDTTFYNLIKTVTIADTLFFQAGSTQTIINNLTLEGTADNLLSLRSTEDGSYWYINPLGARNISFANIKDMNNISFVNVVPLNSVDEGHNEGASFGGSECVCIEDARIFAWLLYGDWRVTC